MTDCSARRSRNNQAGPGAPVSGAKAQLHPKDRQRQTRHRCLAQGHRDGASVVPLSSVLQRNDDIPAEILKRITIKRSWKRNDNAIVPKGCAKPFRIGIISKGGQGERVYSIDGHAITFSAYGGGVASKTGAYEIEGIIRKLTPQECADAMGFTGMDVEGNGIPLLQQYKQFGNSVVVNVVQYIFGQIQSTWLNKTK